MAHSSGVRKSMRPARLWPSAVAVCMQMAASKPAPPFTPGPGLIGSPRLAACSPPHTSSDYLLNPHTTSDYLLNSLRLPTYQFRLFTYLTPTTY